MPNPGATLNDCSGVSGECDPSLVPPDSSCGPQPALDHQDYYDLGGLIRDSKSPLAFARGLNLTDLLRSMNDGLTTPLSADSWKSLAKLHGRKMDETCLAKFTNFSFLPGVKFCPAVFDNFLCWAPTPAGTVVQQNCPPARLSDTSRIAYRVCNEDGHWRGKQAAEASKVGWTNFTDCFPPEVKTLFEKVDDKGPQMFDIARRTRYLEIFGFAVSFLAIVTSLAILMKFRSLRNSRTKIHMSLFGAMLLQIVIRLILYIDQAYISGFVGDQMVGINNMRYVCEIVYALLEYAITVMFLWMFIEGMYLNNLVTTNVLKTPMAHTKYCITGWTLPLINVIIWAAFTAAHYEEEPVKYCWYGYNFLPNFWIIQGPRLLVVIVNFGFLLNILRVLVMKMRRSDNNDINNARKAVRAAFVLLPLLGITNAMDMTQAPLEGGVWRFAMWSYSTHFLRSFQGFFIALIYCFLNSEVQTVVGKYFRDFKARRETGNRNTGRHLLHHFESPVIGRDRLAAEREDTRMRMEETSFSLPAARPYSLADHDMSLQTTDESRRSTENDAGPAIPRSRRSSSGSCVRQFVATIENEYGKSIQLREYQQAKPSISLEHNEDVETIM